METVPNIKQNSIADWTLNGEMDTYIKGTHFCSIVTGGACKYDPEKASISIATLVVKLTSSYTFYEWAVPYYHNRISNSWPNIFIIICFIFFFLFNFNISFFFCGNAVASLVNLLREIHLYNVDSTDRPICTDVWF